MFHLESRKLVEAAVCEFHKEIASQSLQLAEAMSCCNELCFTFWFIVFVILCERILLALKSFGKKIKWPQSVLELTTLTIIGF